ncbi:TonB-dependent receptor [Aquimarina sp. TRL1]|uniref:TonB-dependent receptor n=1 Tax=Aquimarina sp. (strain TRL1) TaxID=2736252 RepID=UPI0015890679|nr:TonB-dependent receptor [Aquimarina sp. TRL1]QKX04632.1 TonB-dependent receptor [Aquimarina sp. TRL1]
MNCIELRRRLLSFLLLYGMYLQLFAQQVTSISGQVRDEHTHQAVKDVIVSIEGISSRTISDNQGAFSLKNIRIPIGEHYIIFYKKGYKKKKYPITIHPKEILALGIVFIEYDAVFYNDEIGTITISDEEIGAPVYDILDAPDVLHATKDAFLSALAYDFSTTFHRYRRVGSQKTQVLLNGLSLHSLATYRPQWSSWGGLNDITKHQEFTTGITANEYVFGSLGGVTNINMSASSLPKGGKISFANSNRTFGNRLMATYSTGLSPKNTAYTISLSKRKTEEGLIEGTYYNGISFFLAAEKKWKKHSLQLAGIYTPLKRGKYTAITEEVFRLKGRYYNPYWGYQNGIFRNAAVRKTEKPIAFISHDWKISDKVQLFTNIAFQTGKTTNSSIDIGGTDIIQISDNIQFISGGGNSRWSNPMHPANLPSYYLQTTKGHNYKNAFLATQRFQENGQLNWDNLIRANSITRQEGKNATYAIREDIEKATQWNGASQWRIKPTDNLKFNGAVNYKKEHNRYYAIIGDLLGGTQFLDVDAFVSNSELSNEEKIHYAQNNLKTPNRLVTEGDTYKYDYTMFSETINGFSQCSWNSKTIDIYLGGQLSTTAHQREGSYENGKFKGVASLGKSDKAHFVNYGIKGGISFHIYGKHSFRLAGMYGTEAPGWRQVFISPRESNIQVKEVTSKPLKSEQILSTELEYLYRGNRITTKLTAFYSTLQHTSNVSSFYTTALAGTAQEFIREVLVDADQKSMGVEIGASCQILSGLELKTAASIGSALYTNNPNLMITGTGDFLRKQGGTLSLGKSFLKGYHIPTGPEIAAQLGISYRDPQFWWTGISANYFANARINSSPFTRTLNFIQDTDGQPFNEYDPLIARELLQQETLGSYFLVNIIGGKSWKWQRKYTLGCFASINNVLNTLYKTGGFEQVRKGNYRQLLEASETTTPVYGNRYYYGYGTSYYINLYVRF